jgi:general stress protein 26
MEPGSADKFWRMIKDIRVTMLTTEDDSGTLRSRPMVAYQDSFAGELWFFTRAGAPKVGEVERHHQVNLSYAEPKDQVYVSVSGWAECVRDRVRIRELWSPVLNAWFPNGPDDPDIALLRVRVEHAEYWDASTSAMALAYGAVKAALTGESARMGDSGRVDLH